MFSLWQFCLEKDLVAGNKIFGGIEFSFSPQNLLFGKRFSWSWWNMRWHYFRYLPPFCSVSTRLCQIQNHSILHSGRQREISQTGFPDIFIWFFMEFFFKTTKMTISKLSISFSNCNWMRRPPRACMIIFLLFSFHRYQLQEE